MLHSSLDNGAKMTTKRRSVFSLIFTVDCIFCFYKEDALSPSDSKFLGLSVTHTCAVIVSPENILDLPFSHSRSQGLWAVSQAQNGRALGSRMPFSYSGYWTGTSMHTRLKQRKLFTCKYFLMHPPQDRASVAGKNQFNTENTNMI